MTFIQGYWSQGKGTMLIMVYTLSGPYVLTESMAQNYYTRSKAGMGSITFKSNRLNYNYFGF